MQLSEEAKNKIPDEDLKAALLMVGPDTVLSLRGEAATAIYFKKDTDAGQAVSLLEALSIPCQNREMAYSRSLRQVVYRPERIQAGKLVDLLENPLVSEVRSDREMQVAQEGKTTFTQQEIEALRDHLIESKIGDRIGEPKLILGIAVSDDEDSYKLVVRSKNTPLQPGALVQIAQEADAYCQAHWGRGFGTEDIAYRHVGAIRSFIGLSHVLDAKIKDERLKHLVWSAPEDAVLSASEHGFSLWIKGDLQSAENVLQSLDLPVKEGELTENRLVRQVRYKPEAITPGKLVALLEHEAVASMETPTRGMREAGRG